MKNRKCLIVDVGLIDYKKALDLQEKILQAKREKRIEEDVLLLLEHPPTITIGKRGSREEILLDKVKLHKSGISIYEIGRGGRVTYHGPGQLVGYPILNLVNYGKDLHLYLRNLEEVIIRTLRGFDILAKRERGLTGVWVNGKKIASIGVQVKNWISMHGFALNVNCDLNYFDLIKPCGMESKVMSSIAITLGRKVKMEDVTTSLIFHFRQIFSVQTTKVSLQALKSRINQTNKVRYL